MKRKVCAPSLKSYLLLNLYSVVNLVRRVCFNILVSIRALVSFINKLLSPSKIAVFWKVGRNDEPCTTKSDLQIFQNNDSFEVVILQGYMYMYVEQRKTLFLLTWNMYLMCLTRGH